MGSRRSDLHNFRPSLSGSLYGGSLCYRITIHAPSSVLETGRQTCREGVGASDSDTLYFDGWIAIVCGASSSHSSHFHWVDGFAGGGAQVISARSEPGLRPNWNRSPANSSSS